MPNFYSEVFTKELDLSLSQFDYTSPQGYAHSRSRLSWGSMVIPDTAVADDVLWLAKIRSWDQVRAVFYANTASTATGITGELGLGVPSTGVVIDDDIWDAAISVEDATAHADVFTANNLTDDQRLWATWRLADSETGTTYTEDPVEDWAVCLTLSAVTALTVGGVVTAIIEYVSGD